MHKTTKAAVLAAALWMGVGLAGPLGARAQDQEEGAVEVDARGAAEPSTAAATSEGPGGAGDASGGQANATESSGKGPGNLRLYLGARLGVGGGFRTWNTDTHRYNDTINMARVTPGFQLGVDYVLWRYFALGGETRFDWSALTHDNGGTKFFLWSLAVKPRARYQFENTPLEIYLAVPGGLSVSGPAPSNLKGKPSAMVGIFAGASYFFNDHWGLNAELGWTWQWLRLEAKVPGTGLPQGINGLVPTVKVERKAAFGQLSLLAVNVTYAF